MKGLNIEEYAPEFGQSPDAFGQDKRFAYFTLGKSAVEAMAQQPWVRYVEIIDEPGVPESTEGRTIQKSNLLNNSLSNGLSYNGDGVKLLVRDDGLVGPHVDYAGRLFNLTNDATGTHGDGVAGVMGGAGNIDPTVEGGSSGADIYVINYQSTFQDNTLSLHQNDGVMITNSSYSNGCNAGYTSTTQRVDQQVHDNPTLMHVFSAGNSNNNDCGYGAGNQWGNITGGHKVGKNVIAVANLFNTGNLVSSSSRGPAHDGRIKPDLAAHAQGQRSTNPNNAYQSFGGTSAAAPSLAGNLGQLIEVYRDLNGVNDPKSSLLKAAAMNSATDLGNAGPDFRYGFGLMHTGRAYDIIANNQYTFANISQGGSNNHTINVPAGLGQLRIMVYWHDPEGTVGTNKALVNDLDMVVNGTLLPLVLDHTPNATTLNNPAVPGVDHLNNVEQVVVNNPSSGNYSVQISGFQVPSGPQEYVLVYTFIEDDITVTYPLGGESIVAGANERIHWDAHGNSGSFTIEYSTDNGASWSSVGTTSGSDRDISWNVPSSIKTANALVRVSRSGQSDVSDEPFDIFPTPNFNVQLQGADAVQISWTAISGATDYTIWKLGTKYMEAVGTTSGTQYTLSSLTAGDDLWLSVSANTATITGERAYAKNFVFNPFSSCGGCLYGSTNFPDVQGFEAGIGSFCQESSDDLDFSINSGGTPSSSTGPSSASGGTNYIYLETSSPNYPSKVGILGSPCYDLSNAVSATLTFDYHMYGSTMGSLAIEVSTDGGQTWAATGWSKSGDQGNQWFTDSIDFSSYQTSQVSFRFVATSGTSWRSDIALDNIVFDAEIVTVEVIGEVGRVSLDHNNVTVNFQNSYTNPIIVAGPPTLDGGHPTTVRISNITSTGFDIRLDEYEYLDEWHVVERLAYMVMEAGEYTLEDSTQVIAGGITANSGFSNYSMGTTFAARPSLVASTVSINDPDAVAVRVRNINTNTFDLRIEEQESIRTHGNETVHFIAMEQGTGISGLSYESFVTGRSFKHNLKLVPLSQPYSTNGAFISMMNSTFGGDVSATRIVENYNGAGNLATKVEEEKSRDSEVNHTTEEIGYIMFYETGDVLGTPLDPNEDESNTTFSYTGDMTLKVFPNPSKGIFYIELKGLDLANEEAVLDIHSLEGKLLAEQTVNRVQSKVILNASEGMYILSVRSGAEVIHKRIQVTQ
jgi:hypothetical protein